MSSMEPPGIICMEALLAEARDPSIRPHRLCEVAQSAATEAGFSCAVVEAAAANPNAPAHLLLYLISFHPGIIMHNPALAMMMVEDPTFLARAHTYSLLDILARADAPAYLVNWLAVHPEPQVATAARLHILSPNSSSRGWIQEMRDRLGSSMRRRTRQGAELARLGLTPASLRATWTAPSKSQRDRNVERAPRSPTFEPGTPATPLLLSSPLERVRAARAATCPDLLRGLAGDRRIDVRAAVANNPATPPAILMLLTEDPAVEVRRRVLANPRTEEPILRRVLSGARELAGCLAEAILENPNTSGELIERLSQHPACRCNTGTSHAFRLRAARHSNTPVELLLELAGDPDLEVREAVAGHPRTPPEAIPRLRERAMRSAVRSDSPACRAMVLMHPDLPEEALELGMRALDWIDRAALTLNPKLSPAHLRLLAQDGSRVVRCAAESRLNGEATPDLWCRR